MNLSVCVSSLRGGEELSLRAWLLRLCCRALTCAPAGWSVQFQPESETKFRPFLLQGHERPLTAVVWNRDGDLFFSSAKDKWATVWYAATGERLGSYEGHNGSIWNLDVTPDSRHLFTASADNSCKVWDVCTGAELFSFEHDTPCRNVQISTGGSLVSQAVYAKGQDQPSHLKIYRVAEDMADQTADVLTTIGTGNTGFKHSGNIIRTLWSKTNRHVLTCSDDCTIRKWDVETGKQVGIIDEDHTKKINDIQFSACGTHFVTSSSDTTAKLFDFHAMDSAPPGRMAVKTYKTNANVNSASISPCLEHVLVTGGQDAADVTTTGAGAGKFEVRVFDKIHENELATIKGHFGPVNYVKYNPSGTAYVSGGEEGFLRLNHLPAEYFGLGKEE